MSRPRPPRARWIVLAPLALLCTISGCDDDDPSPTDPGGTERTVASISLDVSELSIDFEETTRITATVRDQDGDPFTTLPSGATIAWSVGDAQVASVTPVGGGTEADVTGLAPGSTAVEASVSGVSATAGVTVHGPALGTVSGTVTAANGTTPIQGALVQLLADEQADASLRAENSGTAPPQAFTDIDGRYVLEGVPAGDQTLVATRGVFRVEIPVQVVANEEVEAPPAPLDAEGALAYVEGDFDNIQSIVRDELGTNLTRIDATDLASSSVTSQFRFIFINCGVDGWDALSIPAMRDNLLDFMASGGALYISDLEIGIVELLFPEVFVEIGDGDEGTITADVISAPLRAFIGGAETVDIAFNLGGWAAMNEVSGEPEVLLRGDYYDDWNEQFVQDAPLAIAIEHGAGQLVYTSFHTNAAATSDQISVLRYFIYGFGTADLPHHGATMQRIRSGTTFRDLALPPDPGMTERHRDRRRAMH